MNKENEVFETIPETEIQGNDLDNQHSLQQAGAIMVTDLQEMAKAYLTDTAKEALKKVSRSQVIKLDTGECWVSNFFSVEVAKDNVEKGVAAIANDINVLADAGLIHSAIAPIGSISLALLFGKVETVAVFAMVMVPADQCDKVKSLTKFNSAEGEISHTLGDLSLKLGEDEFLYLLQTSNNWIYMSNKSPEEMVAEEIKLLKNILPGSTEAVSVTRLTVMDLSVPYQIVLKNPLMKRFSEVRLEYARDLVVDPSRPEGNQIIQFNRLVSINYIEKETPLI